MARGRVPSAQLVLLSLLVVGAVGQIIDERTPTTTPPQSTTKEGYSAGAGDVNSTHPPATPTKDNATEVKPTGPPPGPAPHTPPPSPKSEEPDSEVSNESQHTMDGCVQLCQKRKDSERVCGADHQTYESRCEALCHYTYSRPTGIIEEANSTVVWQSPWPVTSGECERISCQREDCCTKTEKSAACGDSDVCRMIRCAKERCVAGTNYAPVCTLDGSRFGNAELAACANATVVECPPKPAKSDDEKVDVNEILQRYLNANGSDAKDAIKAEYKDAINASKEAAKDAKGSPTSNSSVSVSTDADESKKCSQSDCCDGDENCRAAPQCQNVKCAAPHECSMKDCCTMTAKTTQCRDSSVCLATKCVASDATEVTLCTTQCKVKGASYQVCGSDGHSYDTECHAKCAFVQAVAKGQCEAVVSGQTRCEAHMCCGDNKVAACQQNKVCSMVRCVRSDEATEKTPELCKCPKLLAPVCSLDPSNSTTKITHPNECEARCKGLSKADLVSCGAPGDLDCKAEPISFVCGSKTSDSKHNTFRNACAMGQAREPHTFVSEGKCEVSEEDEPDFASGSDRLGENECKGKLTQPACEGEHANVMADVQLCRWDTVQARCKHLPVSNVCHTCGNDEGCCEQLAHPAVGYACTVKYHPRTNEAKCEPRPRHLNVADLVDYVSEGEETPELALEHLVAEGETDSEDLELTIDTPMTVKGGSLTHKAKMASLKVKGSTSDVRLQGNVSATEVSVTAGAILQMADKEAELSIGEGGIKVDPEARVHWKAGKVSCEEGAGVTVEGVSVFESPNGTDPTFTLAKCKMLLKPGASLEVAGEEGEANLEEGAEVSIERGAELFLTKPMKFKGTTGKLTVKGRLNLHTGAHLVSEAPITAGPDAVLSVGAGVTLDATQLQCAGAVSVTSGGIVKLRVGHTHRFVKTPPVKCDAPKQHLQCKDGSFVFKGSDSCEYVCSSSFEQCSLEQCCVANSDCKGNPACALVRCAAADLPQKSTCEKTTSECKDGSMVPLKAPTECGVYEECPSGALDMSECTPYDCCVGAERYDQCHDGFETCKAVTCPEVQSEDDKPSLENNGVIEASGDLTVGSIIGAGVIEVGDGVSLKFTTDPPTEGASRGTILSKPSKKAAMLARELRKTKAVAEEVGANLIMDADALKLTLVESYGLPPQVTMTTCTQKLEECANGLMAGMKLTEDGSCVNECEAMTSDTDVEQCSPQDCCMDLESPCAAAPVCAAVKCAAEIILTHRHLLQSKEKTCDAKADKYTQRCSDGTIVVDPKGLCDYPSCPVEFSTCTPDDCCTPSTDATCASNPVCETVRCGQTDAAAQLSQLLFDVKVKTAQAQAALDSLLGLGRLSKPLRLLVAQRKKDTVQGNTTDYDYDTIVGAIKSFGLPVEAGAPIDTLVAMLSELKQTHPDGLCSLEPQPCKDGSYAVAKGKGCKLHCPKEGVSCRLHECCDTTSERYASCSVTPYCKARAKCVGATPSPTKGRKLLQDDAKRCPVEETKECPDGSFVARAGAECQFAICTKPKLDEPTFAQCVVQDCCPHGKRFASCGKLQWPVCGLVKCAGEGESSYEYGGKDAAERLLSMKAKAKQIARTEHSLQAGAAVMTQAGSTVTVESEVKLEGNLVSLGGLVVKLNGTLEVGAAARVQLGDGREDPVCTSDVKVCPDGTYSTRGGAKCHFARCESEAETKKLYPECNHAEACCNGPTLTTDLTRCGFEMGACELIKCAPSKPSDAKCKVKKCEDGTFVEHCKGLELPSCPPAVEERKTKEKCTMAHCCSQGKKSDDDACASRPICALVRCAKQRKNHIHVEKGGSVKFPASLTVKGVALQVAEGGSVEMSGAVTLDGQVAACEKDLLRCSSGVLVGRSGERCEHTCERSEFDECPLKACCATSEQYSAFGHCLDNPACATVRCNLDEDVTVPATVPERPPSDEAPEVECDLVSCCDKDATTYSTCVGTAKCIEKECDWLATDVILSRRRLQQAKGCPEDVKTCTDGTVLLRSTKLQCGFAACPTERDECSAEMCCLSSEKRPLSCRDFPLCQVVRCAMPPRDVEVMGGQCALKAGGSLAGSGTLQCKLDAAARSTLKPGFSPGAVTVEALSMHSGSVYEAEVMSGSVPGVTHDITYVTGDATLGGTLQVTFASDYQLPEGETHVSFTVLQSNGGTVFGSFDTFTPKGVPSGLQASHTVHSSGVTVKLTSDQAVTVTLTSDQASNSGGTDLATIALAAAVSAAVVGMVVVAAVLLMRRRARARCSKAYSHPETLKVKEDPSGLTMSANPLMFANAQ